MIIDNSIYLTDYYEDELSWYAWHTECTQKMGAVTKSHPVDKWQDSNLTQVSLTPQAFALSW
jgi:hypothetical protein